MARPRDTEETQARRGPSTRRRALTRPPVRHQRRVPTKTAVETPESRGTAIAARATANRGNEKELHGLLPNNKYVSSTEGPPTPGSAGLSFSRWDVQRWPLPWTALDDEQIQRYVDTALKRSGNDIERAWIDLLSKRDQLPLDRNLAAAEHYLFARKMGGKWWLPSPVMALFVAGYSLAKLNPDVHSLGYPPTSPPSSKEVKWGLIGVGDGVHDFYYLPEP